MYIIHSPESGPGSGPGFVPEIGTGVEKTFFWKKVFFLSFFGQKVKSKGPKSSKTPFWIVFCFLCLSSKPIPHNMSPPRWWKISKKKIEKKIFLLLSFCFLFFFGQEVSPQVSKCSKTPFFIVFCFYASVADQFPIK